MQHKCSTCQTTRKAVVDGDDLYNERKGNWFTVAQLHVQSLQSSRQVNISSLPGKRRADKSAFGKMCVELECDTFNLCDVCVGH